MSRDVLESFLPPETMKKIALVILSNPLREKNVNIKEYARAFLCKSGYENVEEIMRELENMGVFQGPQAMIRVCVEIFCTAFDNIYHQSSLVRRDLLYDHLGKFEGLKITLKEVIEEPSSAKERLQGVSNQLKELFGIFKGRLICWIGDIRNIDNQGRMQFFLKARSNKSIVDTNINFIHLCLDVLEEVVKIYCIVETYYGRNGKVLLDEYEEFYQKNLLKGDTPRLLYAYEFVEQNKKREDFLHLEDRVKDITNISEYYSELLKEYKDDVEEYENVSFGQ